MNIILSGGRYNGQWLEGVRVEGDTARLNLLGHIYKYDHTEPNGDQVWVFEKFEEIEYIQPGVPTPQELVVTDEPPSTQERGLLAELPDMNIKPDEMYRLAV